MRLLLQYRTGDPRHQHSDVSDEAIRRVLGGLGWLPSDYAFASTKLKEIIERMPTTIRSQVSGGNPILISTRPGTWGVVSQEQHNRVYIRLLHDDLRTLRGEAEEVVVRFPDAFRAEFDRDLGFEPEVVIRRFDSEERMVAGEVQNLRDYRFVKYLRHLRMRELLTVTVLSVLTLLGIGGSVLLFVSESSSAADYWRGFLDRAGTTFFTATLTVLITTFLDYRAWTNLKTRIKWKFDD